MCLDNRVQETVSSSSCTGRRKRAVAVEVDLPVTNAALNEEEEEAAKLTGSCSSSSSSNGGGRENRCRSLLILEMAAMKKYVRCDVSENQVDIGWDRIEWVGLSGSMGV